MKQRMHFGLCLWLMILVLVSFSGCGTSRPGMLRTSTSQDKQTLTFATHGGATPTVPESGTFGEQHYQKTLQENGKTITVPVTTRVWLAFDQRQYPKQQIQISCHPSQAVDSHSLPNASLIPPYYLVGYQTVEPGMCTIKNRNFTLTVKVVALR